MTTKEAMGRDDAERDGALRRQAWPRTAWLTGPSPQGDLPGAIVGVHLGDGWFAIYRLIDQHGSPVVAEVHVCYDAGRAMPLGVSPWVCVGQDVSPGGLTAQRLRTVPLGARLYRYAMKTMRSVSERHPALRPRLGLFGEVPTHPGRGGYPDVRHAELGRRYVAALKDAPDRPIAYLAEQLGWTPTRVRDAVHDARRRGMLTLSVKGRAGGKLTEKAIGVLGARGLGPKGGRKRVGERKRGFEKARDVRGGKTQADKRRKQR